LMSILGVPNQSIDVGVGLARRPAEIGIKCFLAEFRGGDRKNDILHAGELSGPDPAAPISIPAWPLGLMTRWSGWAGDAVSPSGTGAMPVRTERDFNPPS